MLISANVVGSSGQQKQIKNGKNYILKIFICSNEL